MSGPVFLRRPCSTDGADPPARIRIRGAKTMADTTTTPRAMLWAGRGLWAAFVLFMLLDVTMKLLRFPIVEPTVTGLGLPAGSGFRIGVMEAVILALYVYPRTAVLGAILVAALMGGTAA